MGGSGRIGTSALIGTRCSPLCARLWVWNELDVCLTKNRQITLPLGSVSNAMRHGSLTDFRQGAFTVWKLHRNCNPWCFTYFIFSSRPSSPSSRSGKIQTLNSKKRDGGDGRDGGVSAMKKTHQEKLKTNRARLLLQNSHWVDTLDGCS